MKVSGEILIIMQDGSKIKNEGLFTIKDIHDCKFIRGEGELSFKELSGKKIILSGEIKCNIIKSDVLNIEGNIIAKHLESKNLNCNGCIVCNKIVSEKLNLEFSQKNKIDEIYSSKIIIKPCNDNPTNNIVTDIMQKFFNFKKEDFEQNVKSIYIDNIKSNYIDLTDCQCNKIECECAIISGNSTINELFYTDSFTTNGNPQIHNAIKIDKL